MDYARAVSALIFSADRTLILNRAILDVWLSIDGKPVCVKSGETFQYAP
jgi:hypothetical protein